MPASNKPGSGIKVEIFKLANHLKARMGIRFEKQDTGFLDPEAIAEADKAIAVMCETSHETITKLLEDLNAQWLAMRDMPESTARIEIAQNVFTLAHEIKDIGSMCGYDLAAHFAESLRDYIVKTELSIRAQIVICQAHIDAIQAVIHKDLRREAGPEAEELKKMVKIAIEKYS